MGILILGMVMLWRRIQLDDICGYGIEIFFFQFCLCKFCKELTFIQLLAMMNERMWFYYPIGSVSGEVLELVVFVEKLMSFQISLADCTNLN